MLLAGVFALMATSCSDDTSPIGSSLVQGEVTILVDSIVTPVEARSVYYDSFDSRTTTKLLGRINVPEYGNLGCAFVSQMMCAQKMNIPDSIAAADVDSMRLVLSVPVGSLTGDSLAPQQLRVYRLTRQLPADITSKFDPDGYYSSTPLGVRSYTVSNIAKGDSAAKKLNTVRIPVMMPRSLAIDIFEKYRAGSDIFDWPQSFNNYFAGIYVEQNFGNGCIANISKAEFYTYWHRINRTYDMQPDSTYAYVNHIVRDSVCLMASQPEVLSSNIINFTPSTKLTDMVAQGNSIITTPGGYFTDINFPAQSLLDAYNRHNASLSAVSSLHFEIPAQEVSNDYGIGVAPYLLMVKRNEMDDFFAQNKVPDGITSFYATYNTEKGSYQFNTMRSYFLNLLAKEANGEAIDAEDTEFVLVPVDIKTETNTGYNSVTVTVTRCAPYMVKPTMTHLHTERSIITFTYSTQQIY